MGAYKQYHSKIINLKTLFVGDHRLVSKVTIENDTVNDPDYEYLQNF